MRKDWQNAREGSRKLGKNFLLRIDGSQVPVPRNRPGCLESQGFKWSKVSCAGRYRAAIAAQYLSRYFSSSQGVTCTRNSSHSLDFACTYIS